MNYQHIGFPFPPLPQKVTIYFVCPPDMPLSEARRLARIVYEANFPRCDVIIVYRGDDHASEE